MSLKQTTESGVSSGLVAFEKHRGETPLQCLDRFRLEHPKYKDATLSYAGRLDPLASGVLLIMIGDANKKREHYLHLDKEYEVEILFGISTDTHDVLGLPELASSVSEDSVQQGTSNLSEEIIKSALGSFVGKKLLPYPAFSSRTVDGVAMFDLAKQGKLTEENTPKREMVFKSIDMLEYFNITLDQVSRGVYKAVDSVKGDFRQVEIRSAWERIFNELPIDMRFVMVRIHIACESGAYMRTLAHEVGKTLGTKALAWSIKRTKVGDFTV
jgi:tRNA pseudouridine55 synthase